MADAVIIRFPTRATGQPEAATEPAGQEPGGAAHLHKSIAHLAAALESQRQAMAGWREALGSLDRTVASLRHNLGRFHDHLGGVAGGVARLQTESRSLAAWAERHDG